MSYKSFFLVVVYNWYISYDIYNEFYNMCVINIISYMIWYHINQIYFVRVFVYNILNIRYMIGLISYVEHNILISILCYISEISYYIYLIVILICLYWLLHVSYSIYIIPYNSQSKYICHNPTPYIKCQ